MALVKIPRGEFFAGLSRRVLYEEFHWCMINYYVPFEGLMAGKVFHVEIADMIKQGCRKTVVILSPNYLKSPWCNYEANIAMVASPGEEMIL